MFEKKQNLTDLSELSESNTRTIQEHLENYEVEIKKKIPREIVAVIDSTFFGKRIDKFGVASILDVKEKEMLIWKYIKTERKEHYLSLRKELEEQGFVFKAVVIDGSKPLFSSFSDVPIPQICHFHQKQLLKDI